MLRTFSTNFFVHKKITGVGHIHFLWAIFCQKYDSKIIQKDKYKYNFLQFSENIKTMPNNVGVFMV